MIDTEYLEHLWPMRTYLISCGESGAQADIIAVSFCMPVSKEPPLVACAIGRTAYSHDLIAAGGEFIVNVPPKALKPQVYLCGSRSGRDIDKFAESGLTAVPARRLRAPRIRECVAFLECRVRQQVAAGDKDIFIGEVIEAYAVESLSKKGAAIELCEGDFPRRVYGTRFFLKQPRTPRRPG